MVTSCEPFNRHILSRLENGFFLQTPACAEMRRTLAKLSHTPDLDSIDEIEFGKTLIAKKVLDADRWLYFFSDYYKAEVFKGRRVSAIKPDVLHALSSKTCHTHQCFPCAIEKSTLSVVFIRPNRNNVDLIKEVWGGFVKPFVQLDKFVEKALTKYYPDKEDTTSNYVTPEELTSSLSTAQLACLDRMRSVSYQEGYSSGFNAALPVPDGIARRIP